MERAGIEIIPKFEIKYPEYSVITPQTLNEYTVRSLKVGEEESLKASLMTPTALTQHLNKVLFTCLVKKPDTINSIDDFLKLNTVADREAIMYALYHVTYKDKHSYDVTCQKCEHVNSVKVDFSKSFSMKAWAENDSVLTKEVEVPLEMASSVVAIIKQPTLLDEQTLIESLKFSSEEEREKQLALLPITRFEIDIGNSDVKSNGRDRIKDRMNIKSIYNDLPAPDRLLIEKSYEENFGRYSMELKTIVRCEKCQYENNTVIDLVRQFFRAIFG